MSTPSKAERYRQACEAERKLKPDDYIIGTYRLSVNHNGGLEIHHDGGVRHYLREDAIAVMVWLRDTFEPPKDDVAEIIKGLRVEEMPEVALTEAENLAFREQLQYSSKTTPAQDVDMIYRAGAEAMWEKVRPA